MQELLPIGLGLALGMGLGLLRPSLRLPVGAVLVVCFGVLATIVTGEAEISWAFVLIDIPLAAAGAVLGLIVGRRLSPLAPAGGS
jgi:ribose/xylose/arabinose/galactoside ABC-type transport system permease subunit